MATDDQVGRGSFSAANFNRPPRIQYPDLPEEEIDLPAPPQAHPLPDQNWLVSIIPVMGIGVMALFYVLRAATDATTSALFAVPLFLLAIFTIGGTLVAGRMRRRDHQRKQDEDELNYIRTLTKKQARLQAAQDAQKALLEDAFPSPEYHLNFALSRDARLWERRPNDADFMAVRMGMGRVPSPIRISLPDPDLDSPLLDRAFSLADQYRFMENTPVVMTLLEQHALGISGAHDDIMGTVRAMITHLALTHAPHDLQIYLVAPSVHYDTWHWMSWLPHVSDSHRAGSADLMAFDNTAIRNLLGHLGQIVDARREHHASKEPQILLIVDGAYLAESEAVFSTLLREGDSVGASVICLANTYENIPGDCRAVLEITRNKRFHYAHTGNSTYEVDGRLVDSMSAQDAEHIARGLSSVVMRQTDTAGRIPRRVEFLEMYGVRDVDDLRDELRGRWRRDLADGVLPRPVPIGRESLAVDTYIMLDEDHHGPHGVLAGTTGAGKSELLQTLVCALAIEHDPRLVNFLLIDFKGGSTFDVFADLPHTVGTVTNLDSTLVERALEALRAEIKTRQQFFKQMNVRDITQYHRFFARTYTHIADTSYKALPHLFVIVDEFAQLARELPDFMSELVRIAQVGRSLGLHLILGTQSPMDVITEEMNANLQFRICLRVQNVEASRAMLKRPDAAYLPAGWAGRGFFQVGERGEFKQFQTAYVGGDYEATMRDSGRGEAPVLQIISGGDVIDLIHDQNNTPLGEEPFTIAAAIVEAITGYAKDNHIQKASPLLLPPIEDTITLNDVFEMCDIHGWDGRQWGEAGRDHLEREIAVGSAPVGVLDNVYEREQVPLWVHLNTVDYDDGRNGHLLIIGGPATGKTTLLRTIAMSQALLHSPQNLNMYFLSFTGGGLNDISQLPHAEYVVHGTEQERVRRLFRRLVSTLDTRQTQGTGVQHPIIALFVDQYEQLRDTYYEQHMPDFERLINEGRAVGIYVVMTASNISTIPDRLRSLISQRIAFQLGNVGDYMMAVGHMNVRNDVTLPRGRGFIYGNPPLTCQVSLPVQQVTLDNERMTGQMRQLIDDMRKRSGGDQVPAPLRELPTHIPLYSLPEVPSSSRILTPIGRIDDDSLSLYTLDWWEEGPHFIVTGPPGSGKTNFLQMVTLAAATQHPPEALRFLLVDFTGRSLRGLERLKHVIKRVTDSESLSQELNNLSSEMDAFYARWRDDDHNAIMEILPRTVIVIDDYDATSEALSAEPEILRQLRDHVRLHSELGLHVWIAGYLDRTGDPLIRQLLLRRSGFALGLRDGLHNFNVRTAHLPAEMMPEGRAFYAQHNTVRVLQTAQVDDMSAYIKNINNITWGTAPQSRWAHPAQVKPKITPEKDESPASDDDDFDIDTGGLIEDLLGGD